MTSKDLREIRKGLGLTQKEIGFLLGMCPQAYSMIERTRQPTKIHNAAVELVVFVEENGLLQEYIERLRI